MRLLHTLIHYLIGKRRRELPFLVLFAFLLTFAVARVVVYLTVEGLLPEGMFLTIKGVHIHHLSYGIIMLSMFGYAMLLQPLFAQRHLRFLSLFYGCALGLTFDEFGMWINLQDDYWIRHSYDAVIVISLLLLNIVYFRPFWNVLGRQISAHVTRWVKKRL